MKLSQFYMIIKSNKSLPVLMGGYFSSINSSLYAIDEKDFCFLVIPTDCENVCLLNPL